MRGKLRGFTLIELIVTLAVAAILLSVGTPYLRDFIQNNRAASMTNNFVSALQYARSAAIHRGTPVSICASANVAQTACGGAGNWATGWIVFADPNGDGAMASVNDRLRVGTAYSNGETVAAGAAVITYTGRGFVSSGSTAFTLSASDCYGNNARTVTVSNTGRTSIAPAGC